MQQKKTANKLGSLASARGDKQFDDIVRAIHEFAELARRGETNLLQLLQQLDPQWKQQKEGTKSRCVCFIWFVTLSSLNQDMLNKLAFNTF